MSTPSEHPTVQALAGELENMLSGLVEKSRGGAGIGEIEPALYFGLLGLGHRCIEMILGAAGDGDAGPEIVVSDGEAEETYERRKTVGLPLTTVFGPVEIERFLYVGPQGKCVYPLDAQLGLSQKQVTPFLQRRIVRMEVKDAYAGVRDDLAEDLGLSLSVRTIEEVAAYRSQEVPKFREQVAPKKTAPGKILVVNFDGKGIPIVKSEEERTHGKHLKPGEKANKRKMATIATIYEIDPVEHSVEAIASCERRDRDRNSSRPKAEERVVYGDLEDREAVFRAVRREVDARMGSDTIVVIGVDGEPNLANMVEEHFGDLGAQLLLDWYHVTTYLWSAALALQPNDPEAWYERQALRLLQGDVRTVIRGMRQSVTKRGARGLKAVKDAISYFDKRLHIMDYATAITLGAPIGTGSVEGACGHVVRTRMERPGARWSIPGAQAILHLRCIAVSGLAEAHDAWFRKHENDRLHGWVNNVVSIAEARGTRRRHAG